MEQHQSQSETFVTMEQPSPDQMAPQPRQPGKPVITWILIAMNIIMYVAIMFGGWQAGALFNNLKLVPAGFGIQNCWTLVTSMFLHGSLGHLIANMYSLLVLGQMCEVMFGKRKFVLTYMGGGVAGGLMCLLLCQGSPVGIVGASGAIFSLMGLYGAFLLALRKTVGTKGSGASVAVSQAMRNFLVILALNAILVPIYGNIAWEGHLGGFLFGLLMGIPLIRKAKPVPQAANGTASQGEAPRQTPPGIG